MQSALRPAIEARDLRFAYRHARGRAGNQFTLRLDRLTVEPGERVVLHGPSGCGKSTLLRLVAGILVPRSGELHVVGTPVHSATDAERRAHRLQQVGFVFQDYPLVGSLSCLDNVLLPIRLGRKRGITTEDRDAATDLLQRLGVLALAPAMPRELSQGERQRVAIARAVITRAPLLLADEPTTGLDEQRSSDVIELLDELSRALELTVVVVSHDPYLRDRFDRAVELSALLEATRVSAP